jgi:hypothetical protein
VSPSIRIDREVYRFLQDHAEPFSDTPNSVLRRLLGLDVKEASRESATTSRTRSTAPTAKSERSARARRRSRSRPRVGPLLPEEEYVAPILSVLLERGGSAPARAVIEAVGEKLKDKLTAADNERIASGEVRWKNRVQFIRLRLVEEGLLAKDSPRGIWSLSDAGCARALATSGKATVSTIANPSN